MHNYSILMAALFTITAPAFGENSLSKDDAEALKSTQMLLSDEAALKAFANGNKDATGALDQVRAMTGGNPAQMQQVNALSSSIFADMVKSNNGDSAAIQEQLQGALKDPGAFLRRLPPEQQEKIHELGAQIDQQNATNRVPSAAATK